MNASFLSHVFFYKRGYTQLAPGATYSLFLR